MERIVRVCVSTYLDMSYDRQIRDFKQSDGLSDSPADRGYGKLPAHPPTLDVFAFAPGQGFIAVASTHPVAE